MEIWPGRPYPLGATPDTGGANFSVFSEHAVAVDLCLFDEAGRETRLRLPEVTAHRHHGYVPGVRPGQRYGLRVHGPFEPRAGHRFNPNKLLIDPNAKAIDGSVTWDQAVYGYRFGLPEADLHRNDADSAPFMPRCVVVDDAFDWGEEHRPDIPLRDLMIYEVHVKGFTRLHPTIPPELRGTYAGLATPEAIEHLHLLGVTAVELLPVHHFVNDHVLEDKGLANYWGYNSIGYFAPHAAYSSSGSDGEQVTEFKQMVKALHDAGIEVILDVVYNHTGEGNHLGPTLSFRGVDNCSYYRLVDGDERHYFDYTGTGNSLNMRHPNVLQLLMDSLRYWVTEMHVDGFRFDLAATLARELHDVDRLSSFFDVIQQDPVVSTVKLIAEPWDLGEGGYQVGNFPPLWSEWNGKYRDCMRDYWRGQEAGVAEFAYRLTGSSDLYGDARRPSASVNFVTAHDGFTLADLVAYNDKHNEANLDHNHDGESHNRSWNCGAEGPTDDPDVLELRARQQRNLLATLFLSQGVPMLLGGDEMGRSQGGNNNAYCQDNELSWFDWSQRDEQLALLGFTRRLMDFRLAHPNLRRRRWFQGRRIRGSDAKDIAWFTPDGLEMTDSDWDVGFAKALGVFLNGEQIPSLGPRGERIVDDSLLLLFSAHHEPIDFTVPTGPYGEPWELMIDTADPMAAEGSRVYKAGDAVVMQDRSLVVLLRRTGSA
ncbi:MAG TPA: glycogen debranching protein GlgX [Acidimicrobiales bacterium]|nr:glycogen debranching protein GlgX [Acidimicrobiales bacterium]